MLIIIGVLVILIVAILILSGLFIVDNKHVAVFEKMYAFYAVKEKGIYFFTPFLVRRVGYYKKDIQYIKFVINKKTYYLAYVIKDVKKYHYKGHNFNEIVFDACKNELNIEQKLKELCLDYGLEIKNITIN